jgi:hypothetical protein
VLLLGRVPLMGLRDLERFAAVPGYDPTIFGLFALGVGPITSAALLIELLALVVPRWRPLRHGGYEGRSRLWARTRVLTLILAATQSFFILRWATSSDMGLLPDSHLARALVLIVPTVGQLLLLWIAEQIDRHGIGNGISVLIAAFLLQRMAGTPVRSVAVALGDRSQGPLILAAMVLVAVVVSVARRPSRGWQNQPPRPQLLTPAGGVLPYLVTSWLLFSLPTGLRAFVPLGRPAVLTFGTPSNLVLWALLLAGASAGFTWLLNRPRAVAAIWQRGPGQLDEVGALGAARAAHRRGAAQALALGLALVGMNWLFVQAHVVIEPFALAVVGCVVVDVAGELGFRRAWGPVATVWPLHRTYAVGPALAGLAEAGVPAFPRALRHNALLSFWGPYVPVEILVPSARAEEAQERLRALMLGS